MSTSRNSYIIESQRFRVINHKNDLPAPAAGLITLSDNETYFINANIDLTGDRIQLGNNTTIIGASSENCSITSTGLSASTALITGQYAFPFRNVTIKDVGTALDLDGTGNVMALDWTGVNFVNVTTVGTITEASNFIFNKGALIDSQGLKFDGTTGTIAFDDSLLSGDGATADDIIEILPTAIVTRRFRMKYSAVIVSGSNTGVNVDALATIPTEGFILIDVNFSGGGTYLPGINHTDNKALFRNCIGITNTSSVVSYYMQGNATATTVVATNTEYKVAGTTTAGANVQKFTHTDNRATYNGKITRQFKFLATCSAESGNNNQVGMYLAKNGAVIASSEVYGTTNGSGRGENIVVQAIVDLSENDYIEVWTENGTAIQDITVTDLHLTGIQI